MSTCCLSPVSPQKAYIFTFLLSSRLFIEPQELLARVCHLCIEQQQLDKPVLDKVRGRAGPGASECTGSPLTCTCESTSWRGSNCSRSPDKEPTGVSDLSEAQSQKGQSQNL